MSTSGVLDRPWVAVTFALLMTAAATLVCAVLQRLVPAANLVLVYTAAVIITATSTRVLPALVSAFSGFLAFNFFFTEPRGSLLMTHREDVLTAALFLLIASLVGSLAGRLQGKVSSLEFRDSFARIEHRPAGEHQHSDGGAGGADGAATGDRRAHWQAVSCRVFGQRHGAGVGQRARRLPCGIAPGCRARTAGRQGNHAVACRWSRALERAAGE
jgi:hypothetical protein